MPDADETTTSATAADEVEARLVADLEAARANVQRLQEEYDQLLADPAVIQEDKDSHRILLERAKDALRNAERALERHRSGTYGRCSRCGAEIPPERLEALPEADTCVNCS
ncbi:MAG TPA: TraR/DksA C4-type zinc finger protein [Acidimicrobiales bacterium]|jgi:DnaK suppressor protein|nr:TraR/DksA C4-type zinc finger protein [Acidimicrobiales bacterium]